MQLVTIIWWQHHEINRNMWTFEQTSNYINVHQYYLHPYLVVRTVWWMMTCTSRLLIYKSLDFCNDTEWNMYAYGKDLTPDDDKDNVKISVRKWMSLGISKFFLMGYLKMVAMASEKVHNRRGCPSVFRDCSWIFRREWKEHETNKGKC